jgi:hypothetical protein
MRKGFLTLFFALTGPFWLQGQCDGCPSIAGELVDFCYQEAEIKNRCVQFTEDSEMFHYQHNEGKKQIEMKLPMPGKLAAPSTSYLLSLVPDKKPNLYAIDLLIIEHALAQWRQLEAIRLWDLAIVNSGFSVTASGLAYKPLVIGIGKTPEKGKKVNVHYTGYLESGKKFDSSLDKKHTYQFALGLGQVIKGWDEGLAIMTVGSRYLLRIPPALGYGAAGAGGVIPPNATLYFDIQFISSE